MASKTLHIAIAVVLIILLGLLSDPFMLYMPEALAMLVLLGAAALAAVWAGFVMYERSRDEREAAHKATAGHAAYLSGIAILTVALVVQGLSHNIDPWVTLALGVMVISKLIARLVTERNN